MTAPYISVVVPLRNEAPNIRPLVEQVVEALKGEPSWELLLVDDGSTDQSRRIAREVSRLDARVRLLALARQYGQATAIQAGFDRSRGGILVTLDGDLQNDPRDIPSLVRKLEEGYDLVAGFREGRKDTLLTRKIPSWFANRIMTAVTGVRIIDSGCSLKAYRRDLVTRIQLYSDMHRFIPALAGGEAGARITQLPVRHHARQRGQSKYGLARVAQVLTDLITIVMIRAFRSRPLTLFAYGAVASAALGMLTAAGALVAFGSRTPSEASALVLPGAALCCFALSAFLLMLGLVAEVAVLDVEAPVLPLLYEETAS